MSDRDTRRNPFNPERLKTARHFRGLTEWDLAKLTGVEVRAIKRWEKGLDTPTAEDLAQIVLALRFPMRFYFGPDLGEPTSVSICGCGR